jgi:hypothetical protein
MKKDSENGSDDMRPEYTRADLGPLVRGKYFKRVQESSNVVVLEPDVAAEFPNDRAVNGALRGLIRRRKARRKPPASARKNGRRRASG